MSMLQIRLIKANQVEKKSKWKDDGAGMQLSQIDKKSTIEIESFQRIDKLNRNCLIIEIDDEIGIWL